MEPPSVEFYPEVPQDKLLASAQLISDTASKYDAPFFMEPDKYINMGEIQEICDPFLAKGIQNVIVLGTGGSIQTLLALQYLAPRRIVPLPSSRPSELKDALATTSPDNSVVIPISRGGETLDINSTISLFKDYPMLALSSRGAMFDLVTSLGATIMDVPDLSGRFAGSCTNVGIVPAYMAGLNIDDFMAGLRSGYEAYGPDVSIGDNAAKKFATYLYYMTNAGFTNAFSMVYSKWLEGAVGLFVQEISESSGKDGKGIFGTSQPAPICQHSVLELLLGGKRGHSIPLVWETQTDPDDLSLQSNLAGLKGKTALDVIRYQNDATFEALLSRSLPAGKISIEGLSEGNIGQLIALIQSTVYYLCLQLDVNWTDNPMVLIGKQICNEAMAQNLSAEQRKVNRESVASDKFSTETFFP
jgi:glucose-6-phosphate isomerase